MSFCARLWPNCQIQNPQGAGVLQWERRHAAGLTSCWCLCSVMDTLISATFSWLCVRLQWSEKNHLLSECEPQLWVIRTFGIKIIVMATVKLLTFIQECNPLSYSDHLNLWLHRHIRTITVRFRGKLHGSHSMITSIVMTEIFVSICLQPADLSTQLPHSAELPTDIHTAEGHKYWEKNLFSSYSQV